MRHFIHHKTSLFFVCLFYFFSQLNAQTVSPKLVPLPLEIDSIQKNVYWLVDTTQKWTIDSVQKFTFQPFDFSKGIPFNPYHTFWFKFSLQNESKHDSLDALLCTGDYSKIQFYKDAKTPILFKGGDFTSIYNRGFSPNDLCFPIKIKPTGIQHYFLSFYHFNKWKPASFPVLLKSYSQEQIDRNLFHSARLPNYVFFGIFSGTIFILFFYAAFQYKTTLDKAFLFYGCYLITIYIYNLKNYESEASWPFPIFFSYFMELKRVLEVNLEHLGYILYILFIQHFLNLSKDSPKLNKYLTISAWGLAAYVLVDYMLQITLGTRTSITIHHYVRTLFFIPAFALVYHIFFKQKNKLYRYVFVGTCFLLLSSFYTLLGQLFPFEKHYYFGGTIKKYTYEGYHLYMYQMKVGLLLEMICFAFGLSYKSSQQWKNYLALNEKVVQQNLQIQKITNTPTHNENVPDEFLQKIAILLEEHYKDVNFGTKDLANLLHISRSKLARQLKSKKQLSPSNLIRQYRLEKARNLILTTDLTLTEIAYQTGFNEATYFSKSFKNFYQMSPSDLRSPQ